MKMEDWLMSLVWQVVSVVGSIVFVCVVFQVITKGFLFKYVKVFASRGSKLLVEMQNPLNNYFVIGWVEEGFLVFKDKTCKKELNKKVALKPGVIIRWLGIGKVVVDEEKNCFVLGDGRQVNGFDALKFQGIHKRALTEPKGAFDMRVLVVMGVVLAVVLVVSIFTLVQVFSLKDAVEVVRVAVESSARNMTVI
jgi:hypothetical protein